MEEHKDRAIAELAGKSWGVFTSEHAAGFGFNDHHREFRVRTCRWELMHPTVYRIAGSPDTWHARLLAACWATSGLVGASHRSGGALFDLPGLYVWHCHILEHEDNDMMRPFVVSP